MISADDVEAIVAKRIAEEVAKSHFGTTAARESHAKAEQHLQHALNCAHRVHEQLHAEVREAKAYTQIEYASAESCLLYTSDAADE